MKKHVWLIAFLSLSLCSWASSKFRPWYNYYNFHFGTRALSLSNAFTAADQDLTAVFWNPAGIAKLNYPEFYLSYKNDQIAHDYDLQVYENNSYSYHFDSTLNQIDFFSVALPAKLWNMQWGFAISYYRMIPYGFNGQGITETSLSNPGIGFTKGWNVSGSEGIDVLAFSAAFAIDEYFSFGITLQQFFNSGSIQYNLIYTRVPNYPNKYEQYTDSMSGRNLIYGFLFHPVKYVTLGFCLHTSITTDFNTDYLYWEVNKQTGAKEKQSELTSKASVVIPQQYSFGIMLSPFDFLDISCDFSKILWEKGTISNYFKFASLPFPVEDNNITQRNIYNRRVGIDYHFPFRSAIVHVRGGLFSDVQLYTGSDGNQVEVTGYSFGLGVELAPSLILECAFMHQNADFPDAGIFEPGKNIMTHYAGNIISFSLTYRLASLSKTN